MAKGITKPKITRRKRKGGVSDNKTEKNHPEHSAADETTATDGAPSIFGNMASIASKTLTTAAIPIAKTVAEKALGVNPMFQTMFNTKEKEEILTSLHNVKEPEDIVEFIKKIAQIFIVKFFTVILPPLRIFVKTVNPSEKMLKRLLLIQLMVVESTPPVSASITAFQGIQLMADGMCKPLGLDNPIPSINTINNTTAEIISTKIPLEDLKGDKPNEQIITEIEEDLQKTIKDILDGKLLDPIGTIKHEIISILVGPLLDKLKSEFKTDKPDADAIEKLLTEQLDKFKSDPKSPIGSLLEKAEKASEFAKQSGIPSFDLDEEINKMKKSISATIFEKIKSIPDINTLETDKLIEMLIEEPDGHDETNAPSPPTSGETVAPTSGETVPPTSGETVPPTSGEPAPEPNNELEKQYLKKLSNESPIIIANNIDQNCDSFVVSAADYLFAKKPLCPGNQSETQQKPSAPEPTSKEIPGGSKKKRRKTKKSIRKYKKKTNKKTVKKSVKKSKKNSHKK